MFDQHSTTRKRIAIVGGGISGLSAAYYLSPHHDVTLYEAAPRLGGHARTVIAGKNGNQPVDTGFIVFNYHTYPHLTGMFADLDVPVKKSDMSFGVSVENGALEYAMKDIPSLAAQTRNLARPQFWRMMTDILRFNRRALAAASDPDLSLGALLIIQTRQAPLKVESFRILTDTALLIGPAGAWIWQI